MARGDNGIKRRCAAEVRFGQLACNRCADRIQAKRPWRHSEAACAGAGSGCDGHRHEGYVELRLFLLTIISSLAIAPAVSADPPTVDFNRDIRPIFSDK